MPKDISELLKKLDFHKENKNLLIEAMTHKSYSAEHNLDYDNQRLEFLGDAVLQILITEYLYSRYTDEQEGKLTKMRSALARQAAFAKLARKLHISDYIRMGKGEMKNRGNERVSTLCDAFEALAGAIYLDGGLEPVAKLIMPMLKEVFPDPKGESFSISGDLSFTRASLFDGLSFVLLKAFITSSMKEGPRSRPPCNQFTNININNAEHHVSANIYFNSIE